jgi:MerR family regulatory protein
MATTTSEPLLTIGQVAERSGLRTSHIRFYERIGVLPEPERVGGQRRSGSRGPAAAPASTSARCSSTPR